MPLWARKMGADFLTGRGGSIGSLGGTATPTPGRDKNIDDAVRTDCGGLCRQAGASLGQALLPSLTDLFWVVTQGLALIA
jgi:hypothetical protein